MKPALLSLLMVSLLVSGCTSPNAPNTTAEAPALPSSPGHAVFLNNCLTCHQGPGNPPGPNSLITQSQKLASLESFKSFLRNPAPSMMPPFPKDRLTDEEVAQLYTFVTQPH